MVGKFIADVACVLVAGIHVYFLYLEMFLWDTPKGRKVFKTTVEFSKASKVLAENQGLYNGFLAAGLAWGTWKNHNDSSLLSCGGGVEIQFFFLSCVIIAGIYGAATASKNILYFQAVPGIIALGLLLFF